MCLTNTENNIVASKKPWTDYTLEEKSQYLIDNFDKFDCEFLVGPANNDEKPKSLKSFKWILSDVSPEFRKMLEKNDMPIRIEDIAAEDFEKFLYFIHFNHSIKKNSIKILIAFFNIGKKYSVDYLMREMTDLLTANWHYLGFHLFLEAYSTEDTVSISLFETLILQKKSLGLSDSHLRVIPKISVKMLLKLSKLLLLYGCNTKIVDILYKYSDHNGHKLSNLEKDAIMGFALILPAYIRDKTINHINSLLSRE